MIKTGGTVRVSEREKSKQRKKGAAIDSRSTKMSVGLGRKGNGRGNGKETKEPVRRRGRKQSKKERETGPVRWRGRG